MKSNNWKIFDNVDGWSVGYRAIVTEDGETICNPSPMGEANARLISAAPDLLEAAKQALKFIRNHWIEEHGQQDVGETWGTLEAAIDKATKEQS